MKNYILSILILFLGLGSTYATHNLAGEIVYEQLDAQTIQASIYTYTKASSVSADRDSLQICWGDGSCEFLLRVNGPNMEGELITDNIRMNIYIGQHTYGNSGNYTISLTDPNRNSGVLNINFPNSDNVPFHLESSVTIDPANNEGNQSPTFLHPPVDIIGYAGMPFEMAFTAYDHDEDSLSYELITPLQDINLEVSNYASPETVGSDPTDFISLDAATGLFHWENPQVVGDYGIAIRVKSYRNGVLYDEVIRDIQITILEMGMLRPEITVENNLDNGNVVEVLEGDTVRFHAEITDLDAGQELEVSCLSGLLGNFFDENASYTLNNNGNMASIDFTWVVKQEHMRQQPYDVVIRAKDDLATGGQTAYAIIRFRTAVTLSVNPPGTDLGKFLIAPNPINQYQLRVEISDDILQTAPAYFIYNAMGRKIATGQIQELQNSIPLPEVPIGLYYLQLQNQEFSLTQTFMVN